MINDNNIDIGNRIILLSGDVDESLYVGFYRNLYALQRRGRGPITIHLHTDGGDIDEGLAIYDAIVDCPSHITIYVPAKAWSMGAIILQAADERIIHPNATTMAHIGSMAYGEQSPSDVESALAKDQLQSRRCDDILFERLKAANPHYSRSRLDRLNAKGEYLNATKCVALGLVDKIGKL